MHATLTDFGLMKDLRSTTQITKAGSVIGTFDYLAPEQLKEGPVDARTDVYALGGVLYQALTGRVPYQRETAAATMLAHLDSPPPSVLSVLPDASELLGEVVRRAMAKDPRDRYPSAGDLGRSALAAAQDRRASTEERSVAAGDAAPDSIHHRAPTAPLPPALAVETGGGKFVGREALTAGDAALTVSDPGHLMNGTFALPEPPRVSFSESTWTGPASNDAVTVNFKQAVKATDALRTGPYAKTLTFTLSTTTP